MITISFIISAAIGAIGGIAISSYVGGISYASGGIYGMMGFIAAVLGGWGSSTGAVVGGLALGIVQALCHRPRPRRLQERRGLRHPAHRALLQAAGAVGHQRPGG